MTADEVRFAEAIASLTARLQAWHVPEPHEKAQAFVSDMIRAGWRPRALAVATPAVDRRPSAPPPADLLDALRASIAQARAAYTTQEETPDA